METTDRFPQVFGKPHRTRFPTAPTAIIGVCGREESNTRTTCRRDQLVTEAEDSLHCRTSKRRVAPITKRGPTDHDDVDGLITMRRTS
jgi:hypothetical protein